MGSETKAHPQRWDNFGNRRSAMDRAGKYLTLPYLTHPQALRNKCFGQCLRVYPFEKLSHSTRINPQPDFVADTAPKERWNLDSLEPQGKARLKPNFSNPVQVYTCDSQIAPNHCPRSCSRYSRKRTDYRVINSFGFFYVPIESLFLRSMKRNTDDIGIFSSLALLPIIQVLLHPVLLHFPIALVGVRTYLDSSSKMF